MIRIYRVRITMAIIMMIMVRMMMVMMLSTIDYQRMIGKEINNSKWEIITIKIIEKKGWSDTM